MIFILDNYDSFVFNLARYFQLLGQQTVIVRNDATDVGRIRQLRPRAIVLSPGPCTPAEAGCSLAVVQELCQEIPILGVCLGHQTIAAALGGLVVRAQQPMHGSASLVEHDGTGLFAGLPSPLRVGRYHSLVAEEASLPLELNVTARTTDGTIMAVAHRTLPLFAVQFHPESVLTEGGFTLLANFLQLAGIPTRLPTPSIDRELRLAISRPFERPNRPLTF